VHFRTLEDESDPPRRTHVCVVEELAERRERRVDRARAEIEAEQRVDDERAEDRVDRHLQRMFVERGDDFDPLRAVMDLMEPEPEDVELVSPTVPPVEDERGDEVGDEAAGDRMQVRREMEHRSAREPALPGDAGQEHDPELDDVDGDDAKRPSLDSRQAPARCDPLENETEDERAEDERQHGRYTKDTRRWF
jgi:hypothetical protein